MCQIPELTDEQIDAVRDAEAMLRSDSLSSKRVEAAKRLVETLGLSFDPRPIEGVTAVFVASSSVYSRTECVFAYCPYVGTCSETKTCQHPVVPPGD